MHYALPQIVITVDPLTSAGQRAAALIPLLSDTLQYSVTVLLMPRLDISDFPLQNFYRYVTSSSQLGGLEGGAVSNTAAGESGPHIFFLFRHSISL